ncbi:RlmE family RNA methyltransferase [Henriciella mobilis]|uniref:Ribosomal RNA large subunit methyltransferase E n=1 Tax=Henriciella mobilis TaxID=2305467 RepID=A0A399RHL6_9PROT|nr:RlmE family RNA methyltransferase [Henriciella mobilis]RIJ29325.1 RlmE family RNA methyltransferase [Henriciella mobilis]
MSDEGKRRWKGPPKNDKGSSGRRMGERKIIAYNAKDESSKRWIERQLSDPYVQRAKADDFRARAAYKLIEIDEKTGVLKGATRVVDLGSAPGGWLQVCLRRGVKEIVGIDLLPVDPIPGAHIVQGDINDPDDVAAMMEGLSGPPDLVLSDMAANTTGHKQTDSLRTAALAEMALWFAGEHLAPGGNFCSKVFQGGATPDMMNQLKQMFRTVKHVKPPASRAGSPELFVVAQGFRGKPE